MLVSLRIKNLALVEDLNLELRPGCNVITGETGAGKSILIGALSLVLGERAAKGLIRSGCDACAVEAVFDVSNLRAPLPSLLEENGLEPCEENRLLLKRTFTAAGANRQFVNGSPTTLATLALLGESLVDMHGPHDHQSLLHPARQLAILDAYAGLNGEVTGFAELLRERAEVERRKTDLIVDEHTYARQLDLLRHQSHEIATARLQPGEEEELHAEHARAANATQLIETGQRAQQVMDGDEPSLTSLLGALGRDLHALRALDESTGGLAELHEQITVLTRELQSQLAQYVDRLEADPERLAQLEQRLALLQSLKRKHGPTLAAVIAFGAETNRRLAALESRDAELDHLNAELTRLDAKLAGAGRALTAKRRKVLPKLGQAAMAQLRDLGFQQSRFEAELTTLAAPAPGGFDRVEFQFAPNPGEPPQPLRAIASSGEMARVMLALKTVLAAEDEIPVLVFDEVDANVGGETAHAVGDKMRQIARQRQVLCISHLPQVAAAADAHYVVTKEVAGGRTITDIREVTGEARVEEVARMLGGKSGAARQHAEELLANSD